MDNPYDILWDPEYAGQVHLLNGSRDTLAAALLRMGADVNTAIRRPGPGQVDAARRRELMNWKFDHTDYNELGSFDIHQTWSGQVAYYQYYLPKGLPITAFTYVWPPTAAGGNPGIITNDVFAIPKGGEPRPRAQDDRLPPGYRQREGELRVRGVPAAVLTSINAEVDPRRRLVRRTSRTS